MCPPSRHTTSTTTSTTANTVQLLIPTPTNAAYTTAPLDPARGRRLDAALGRLAAVVKLLAQVKAAAAARGTTPAVPPGAAFPRLHASGERRVG
jgi:hypothetical protein